MCPWFLCTFLPTRTKRTSYAAARKQHHQPTTTTAHPSRGSKCGAFKKVKTPNASSSHIQERIGFSPWRTPVREDTMHLNGALNRECDATVAPPPLPQTTSVKAFARFRTVPAAQTWTRQQSTPAHLRDIYRKSLGTSSEHHHDAASKHQLTLASPPRRCQTGNTNK
jgi:hypothetical protein